MHSCLPLESGPALERLAAVPWQALEGLGPALCEALRPVLAGGPDALPAERALDRFLRARRGLGAGQRQAVAEALFGVALWRRRLLCSAGLREQAQRCGEPGAEPPDAAVLLCALLRDLGGQGEAAAVRLSGAARAPGRGTAETWGERWSLPRWLEQRLGADLGGEAEAFAAASSAPGPVFVRANRLRCTRAELADALRVEGLETEACAFAPDGLRLRTRRPNLLVLQAVRGGLLEVQDEGSQLLGALVEAGPGETVLDACAGAGGKSLQLAAAVGASGRVVCADPDAARLGRLRMRATRAGASAVAIAGAEAPPGLLADRVLADVPCSELGALRRGPDARWRLDPRALAAFPPLQLAILERAAAHVRPGGRLVYATCTVLRAENEEVADAFARAHPGFAEAVPGAGWLDPSLLRGGRFTALPHRHGTDGFFAAAWERAR